MSPGETRSREAALRTALARALARPTPAARLDELGEVLTEAFGADRCILGRVVGGTATAVAGVGLGVAGTVAFASLPLGRGIVGRALRTGQTQLVADVLRDPDYYAASALTRSELVTPVSRAGRPVLMLNLESNRVGAFTAADAAGLEAAAAWLAPRLELLGLGA